MKIYEVVGDDEHIFLYTWPAHFYFGGVETYLWMQDGITLGTPTAEMVSSVTVVSKEEETSAQVEDPVMIAALLETYNGNCVQVPNSEDWEYGSLIMYHKDFPFLQYEIEYRYSPKMEISYCRSKNRLEWLLLPDEWFAVISEHDFPTIGE